MNGIVFAPDFDHPDERDSGEFCARGERIAELHGGTLVNYDNELPIVNRATQVLATLAGTAPASLQWLAFCCHGWSRGIQAGFDTRGGIKGALPRELAAAIKVVAAPGPFVLPLYACSTDEDPLNGFAEQFAVALDSAGVEAIIYAHTVLGHATANPMVKYWHLRAGVRDTWLVDPANRPRWHKWVIRMHDAINPAIPASHRPTLDLRYPWMTQQAVFDEVDAA